MQLLNGDRNDRILVVDDNEAIHEDFNKILAPEPTTTGEVDALAASLFGESRPTGPDIDFQLTHALQGQEAFDLVRKAVNEGSPFALAFVDVRMPPGWNGIETVERIWEYDHEIEIVLCTAYSDFSWEEISGRLTHPERLLILRKPFDPLEVRQLAYGLTSKWFLRRQAACRMQDLEIMVEERMRELEALRSRLEQVAEQQHGLKVG
jgi:DNA-binding LytR/AlgR family response regulator